MEDTSIEYKVIHAEYKRQTEILLKVFVTLLGTLTLKSSLIGSNDCFNIIVTEPRIH